tara:strand:- start:403 stop:762 length:360 start_codon:yes stop_codon:yes gene_type:complete
MKKYLILLIIPFLFFSTGCEKDTIEDTQLDSDLYGNWTHETGGSSSYNYCYDMTLSSNGRFVYQSESCYYGDNHTSNSGDWWVEGNHLVLSGDSWGLTEEYVVGANTLEYDNKTWTKQN